MPTEKTPLAIEEVLEPPPSTYNPVDMEFGIEILIPEGAPPELMRTRMRQRTVLELMMLGVGIVLAGKLAKVHRGTIHRWMHHDEHFRAAIQTWQQRRTMSARSRMIAAADDAVSIVLDRMKRGEMGAATTILRATGVLDARQPLLPQSASDSAPQSESAEKSTTLETRMRKFLASLSPQESTRLLSALAESSQPKLPEAEESETEKSGPEAESA